MSSEWLYDSHNTSEYLDDAQEQIESMNIVLSTLKQEMWDLNQAKKTIETRLAEVDRRFIRIRERVREVTVIRNRQLGRFA